jgi:SHAQKYF class myb-like DNA-binding protein
MLDDEFTRCSSSSLDCPSDFLFFDDDDDASRSKPIEGKGTWTKEEHERFLAAVELYPKGPWKRISEMIKTRTIRQTQTHAQKYREKLARRNQGLRTKASISSVQADVNLYHAATPMFIDMQALWGSTSLDMNIDTLDAIALRNNSAIEFNLESSTHHQELIINGNHLKTDLDFFSGDNHHHNHHHDPSYVESMDFLIQYLDEVF